MGNEMAVFWRYNSNASHCNAFRTRFGLKAQYHVDLGLI